MAWGFISELSITPEEYDELNAEIREDPSGPMLHTASRTDGGMRIIDFWQSEDDYRRLEEEQLMPAMGRLGWPAPDTPPPDEVAWKTAIEAAPWLLGDAPKGGVDADEAFEKLRPFKDLVAEDIADDDPDAED